MKYDLIVVGAGPGGLMAARTAARDGLKVALIERKRNITEINRACVQIFYLNKLDANWLTMKPTPKMDAYIEQVSAEVFPNRCRFNYLDAGFSLDYEGPLRAYYNWLHFSPSGHCINRYSANDFPWGFFYFKEAFLGGLLSDVTNAGVDIMTDTTAHSVDNMADGVEVKVAGKTGEQTLVGRAAVVADGLNSRIVEGLGLNKDRPLRTNKPRQILIYVMEGVNCPYGDNSWIMWSIPSLKADNIYMGLGPNNCNLIGAGSSSAEVTPSAILDGIMKWPAFSSWFTKARVVGKMGTTLVSRPSLRQVVTGNSLVVGDAGASVESWIQGAVVGGYKAAKAVQRQWSGHDGYREYTDWWVKAFAFNLPEYPKMATDPVRGALKSLGTLFSRLDDKDIDDLYKLLEGVTGIPALLAASNMTMIKGKRPELYAKMQAAFTT